MLSATWPPLRPVLLVGLCQSHKRIQAHSPLSLFPSHRCGLPLMELSKDLKSDHSQSRVMLTFEEPVKYVMLWGERELVKLLQYYL